MRHSFIRPQQPMHQLYTTVEVELAKESHERETLSIQS